MATLAVNADHRSLAEVARAFLTSQGGTGLARAAAEAETETLPSFWGQLEKLGWLGLHLPEAFGGQGFGIAETAVVAEELGRVVAPGPFLPTVIASAAIDEAGTEEQRRRWLPGLASGATTAAVGLDGTLVRRAARATGEVEAALGACVADLLVVSAGEDLLVLERTAPQLTVESVGDLDPSRRVGVVRCSEVPVPDSAVLPGARRTAVRLARAFAGAEAAGLADACTVAARDYALTREQFDRPIGAFQAVKHQCADMLVAAELAAAAAWGAVQRADSPAGAASWAALAATQALPAATRCAARNIQIHGGVGYTWEHDAHLYLKRALALETLYGAGAADDVVAAGHTAAPRLELPDSAAGFRTRAAAFRKELEALPAGERRGALARSGYLVPHYPPPFGLDAGPVEQLVIEEELHGIGRPDLGIGAWILPTLVQHGTAGQLDRWVWPALLGELRFCQLFSEPGAGSDAAAIRTSARRTEGGWLVSGQKTWTSDALQCNRGLMTVRTDPAAPKHAGVTMMVLDLRAEGVEVRPIRDLTGASRFNEVFVDEVFVPDEDVVGEVGEGWKVARATIGNERVTIGTSHGGSGIDASVLLDLAARHPQRGAPLRQRLGELLAEEAAMARLNLKHVQGTIEGTDTGTDGNVGKLLSAEHAQRATELALALVGPAGVGGAEPEVVGELLYSRGLTLGGGTSEISRNQIAERVLGLPRDRR